MKRILLAGAAILLAAVPLLSWAQTSPLIIDQNRTDRSEAQQTAPQAAQTAPLPAAAAPVVVTPFVLRELRVEGTSIPPATLTALAQPYIGTTVDAAAVNRIADSVASAYAEVDIALYSVSVPQQDFSTGTLRLVAAEGYVAQVDIHGDVEGDISLVRGYADRMTTENPLTRTTLERYISLIRDIPGLEPDIQLYRTDTPGAVVLSIGLVQRRVDFGLGFGNSGNSLLGRAQFQISLTLYRLFGQGSATSFSFSAPTELERFQHYSAAQSLSIGNNGTVAQLSAGYLHTEPEGSPLSGEAKSAQLLFSHPLIRSYEDNLHLRASIDALNSSGAILGQTPANERVRALRAAAVYSRSRPETFLALNGIASLGLDALDAQIANPALAVSDFFKLNASGTFERLIVENWILRLRASGQYGAHRLPVSEFYVLGGNDFGRGYPAASIFGDTGVAATAEIIWRVPFLSGGTFAGTELYGFVDGGRIWYRSRLGVPTQRFDLASAGGGTRITVSDRMVLQLEGAQALDDVPGVARAGTWRLNISLRLTY